jgi:hypothetical protein
MVKRGLQVQRKRRGGCQILWSACLQKFNYAKLKIERVSMMAAQPGLPDFSWHNIPERRKIYQIAT